MSAPVQHRGPEFVPFAPLPRASRDPSRCETPGVAEIAGLDDAAVAAVTDAWYRTCDTRTHREARECLGADLEADGAVERARAGLAPVLAAAGARGRAAGPDSAAAMMGACRWAYLSVVHGSALHLVHRDALSAAWRAR